MPRNLKRLRVPAVLVLALFVATCAKAPPELPKDLLPLWQANETIIVLGTTSRSAIALNAVQRCDTSKDGVRTCQPLLSDDNTRIVLDAVEDGIITIRAVPNGWKATANEALDRVNNRLDVAGKAKFKTYVEAARLIINGL